MRTKWLRRPGIEPGLVGCEAAMLTTIRKERVIEKKGTSWYKRFDLLYFINFKAKTILGFPGIQIPNPRKYYSG